MARQNVGNPKFYIDLLSYYAHSGIVKGVGVHSSEGSHLVGGEAHFPELLGLNPSHFLDTTLTYDPSLTFRVELTDGVYFPQGASDKFFFGFLGHNFGAANIQPPEVNTYSYDGEPNAHIAPDSTDITYSNLCNLYSEDAIEYNGWSLAEFSGMGYETHTYVIDFDLETAISADKRTILGSLCFGSVFQMPHSPDLSLTVSREFDGIKYQTSKGGSTLSQVHYSSASNWAGHPAWDLSTSNTTTYINNNFREPRQPNKGRRTWNLKFSYIDSDNLFPITEGLNRANPTDSSTNPDAGYDSSNFLPAGHDLAGDFDYGYQRDSSFISRFLHYTIGGALTFIFQPDGNNNSPDQWALCKLDQDSISFKQVAHNVYDVSLKIMEVW